MFSIKSLKFSKAPCSSIPLLSRHCWIRCTAFRSLESSSAVFSQWHDVRLTCSFWHVLVLPLATGTNVRKPQREWSLGFLPNGHIQCQMSLHERELDRSFNFDGLRTSGHAISQTIQKHNASGGVDVRVGVISHMQIFHIVWKPRL